MEEKSKGDCPFAIDGLESTPIVSGQECVNLRVTAFLVPHSVWDILQDGLLCRDSERRTDHLVFKTSV